MFSGSVYDPIIWFKLGLSWCNAPLTAHLSSHLLPVPSPVTHPVSLSLPPLDRAREGGARRRRMNGGKSALQPSARQSVVSCSELEPNCTVRLADTLALSPAWSDNGSAVDADRLVELQFPASTVSPFSVYCGSCSLWFILCVRTHSEKNEQLNIYTLTAK